MKNIDSDVILELDLNERFYRGLYLIRELELRVVREYPTDNIKSPIHTSIGQEFVSVGVCEALERKDVVFGTYRGHALYLARGGGLNKMVAELFGRKGGCAAGKAGSMHLIDLSVGMMGTSAIVAASIPHAVGYALALRRQGKHQVVVCFFGEGATDEGVFYESINFSALKRLPIVFVCENNGYAIYSKQSARAAGSPLWEKVERFGIAVHHIANGDIHSVYETAKPAIQKARNGNGPVFLEIDTYRWLDHVGPSSDWELGYRSKDEAENWVQNDQAELIGRKLAKRRKAQIESEVRDLIDRAFEYAAAQQSPDVEDLLTNVYA